MDSRTKYALALTVLTLLVLGVRLLIAFQTSGPSFESYDALLQARSIRESGLPLYHDPYSYEGRVHIFTPIPYYLFAIISFLLPLPLAVKLLPHLFMAALVPLVYLIGHRLTKNKGVSLIAAFFAGFSPAIFTTDNPTTGVALPIAAALLLGLLNLEEHPVTVLVMTAVLTLFSPLIWLFLAAYIVYLIILAAERLPISPRYVEVALFTFLLASWYTLVTYKAALLRHGFSLLSESLPASVRAATFSEFTLLTMVYAVGVIPLALGAIALYTAAFEERNKRVFLVASLGLVILFGASLQLLPLQLALVLLSLLFVLLAAPGLHAATTYLRKTRFAHFQTPLVILLLFFFFVTSLLPSLVAGLYPGISPSAEELEAAAWVRENTTNNSILLASPKTGFFLNTEAHRKYVADEDYLLIANPDGIIADIDTIYTTTSPIAALEVLGHYGVTHIYFGSQEFSRYPSLGAIAEDQHCFPAVYENGRTAIRMVNCTLEVS